MLWKAFSDETGLELKHWFRQRDLVLQLWGSNMKLFDQGIQLLFQKSKITVQKELINIFNYYYILKSQNFFQYLNIQ